MKTLLVHLLLFCSILITAAEDKEATDMGQRLKALLEKDVDYTERAGTALININEAGQAEIAAIRRQILETDLPIFEIEGDQARYKKMLKQAELVAQFNKLDYSRLVGLYKVGMGIASTVDLTPANLIELYERLEKMGSKPSSPRTRYREDLKIKVAAAYIRALLQKDKHQADAFLSAYIGALRKFQTAEAELRGAEKDRLAAEQALARDLISGIPGAGEYLDFMRAVTGKDQLTGETLSGLEQLLEAFLVITPEAIDLLIKKNKVVREAFEKFTKKAGNMASETLQAIARRLKNKTDEMKTLIMSNRRRARELGELGREAIERFGKNNSDEIMRLKRLWTQGKQQGKRRVDDLAAILRRAGTEDELMAAYAALRRDKFALNELQGKQYADLRRQIKARIEDRFFTHVNSSGKVVRGAVDDKALGSIGSALRSSANKMDDDALLALRKRAQRGELGLDELEKLRAAEARKKMNQQLRMHNQKYGAVGGPDIDFDQVEFSVFNATNKPPAPDKIGFDRDITYRALIPEHQVPVKRASGRVEMVTVPATEIDIPANLVEPHYNKSLYEHMNPNARPVDMLSREGFDTVSEFGSKMDHQVTDYLHGDAYLVDDINEFFRNPTTLTADRASSFSDTVIFKSEHWFERGSETLDKMGLTWADLESGKKFLTPEQACAAAEAMSEVAEGIRQSSKQYDNYLTQFISKGGFDPHAALSPELIEGMNVFKRVREGAISVPEAKVALEAMGMTISDVVKRAGLEYEAFKRLRGAGIQFSTASTRSAFKNMLREMLRKSIAEAKAEEHQKEKEEEEEKDDEAGGGGKTYGADPPPTRTDPGVLGLPSPAKLSELEGYYEFCGKKLLDLEAEVKIIKSELKGLEVIIPARDKAEELIEQLKILHTFLNNFLAKYRFKLTRLEIHARAQNKSGTIVVNDGAVLLRKDSVTFNVDASIPESKPTILMRMMWQICSASGMPLPGDAMQHRTTFFADGSVDSVDWTFNIPDKFPKKKYLLRVIQQVVDFPDIKSVGYFSFRVGDPVKLKKLIITPGKDLEKDHKKLNTEQDPNLLAYMEFADSLFSVEVEAKIEEMGAKVVVQEDKKTFPRRNTDKLQRLCYSLHNSKTKKGDDLKFTLKLVPHVGEPAIGTKNVLIEEKVWQLTLKVTNSQGTPTKTIMRHDLFYVEVEMNEELQQLEIGETEWFVVTPGATKIKAKGEHSGKAGLKKEIQTSEKWTNIGKYEIIAVVHAGEQVLEGHTYINLIEEPKVDITVFNDKGDKTSEIKQGKRFDAKATLPTVADDVEIGEVQWGIRPPGASDYKFSARSRKGKKGLHLGVKTEDEWKLGIYGLICKIKLGDITASGEAEFELTEPGLIFAKMTRPVKTGQWSRLVYPEEEVVLDLSKPFKLEGLGKHKHRKYWKIENKTEVYFRPIKDGLQRVKFDFVNKKGERAHFKSVGKAELTEMPVKIDWGKVITRNKKGYIKFEMELPDSFEERFSFKIRPDDGVKIKNTKKKRGVFLITGEICLNEMDNSKDQIIIDLTDKTDAIAQGIIEIDVCECMNPPAKVRSVFKSLTDPKEFMKLIDQIKKNKMSGRKLCKDWAIQFKWMGGLNKCRHIDSKARKWFKARGDLYQKLYDYSADGELSDAEADSLARATRAIPASAPKIKPGFMRGVISRP